MDEYSVKPNLNYVHAFAILRHEGIDDVTVKVVLWDYDKASEEVARLNQLGLSKYTLQITRVERQGSHDDHQGRTGRTSSQG